MKSTASLLPAILATAANALAVPQAPAPAELLSADAFTLDDVVVDPYTNYVPTDEGIRGQDPEAFLNEDLPALDLEAGAAAWAAIVAEFTNTTNVGPFPGSGDDFQMQVADYHFGITAQAICGYFRGVAYKTRELRRPTEQWQAENVPWLIYNKGPYIVSGFPCRCVVGFADLCDNDRTSSTESASSTTSSGRSPAASSTSPSSPATRSVPSLAATTRFENPLSKPLFSHK